MTEDPTHTTPASPSADRAATVLALLRGADERVALLEPASGDRVTYGALRDAVDRIGRELVGGGVLPGDAVALAGANGPETSSPSLPRSQRARPPPPRPGIEGAERIGEHKSSTLQDLEAGKRS